MNINEAIDVIMVSTLAKGDEDFIEIIISEIFTPSFFWVQLRGFKKNLQAMMHELQ